MSRHCGGAGLAVRIKLLASSPSQNRSMRFYTAMPKPDTDREPISRILFRSTVSAVLTMGVGVTLYVSIGPTVISAVLFALACGVISIIASYI